MPPIPSTSTAVPRRVATGVTTAFLGDERTLREFIAGDLVKTTIDAKGGRAVLYLFNDSYDPLNYRQLRVAVNKDATLLKRFETYCGGPISEIPDPFECHQNYSQHFENALLERLGSLDIHPTVVDSYQAYRSGVYADLVATTFDRYAEIQERLAEAYGRHMAKDLFRVQCPRCQGLDETHISHVRQGAVDFTCARCGTSSQQPTAEIRGKLSWKLDCAARWNLYGVDIETFSKAHVAELGSVPVARFVSQHFYGGKVPSVIRYGDVRISRDLSYKLLEILPPAILKKLFATHLPRDLNLTKESVETFCRKYAVRPGVSYVEFVRTELPFRALCDEASATANDSSRSNDMKALVPYASRFSELFYEKTYQVRAPTPREISSADHATAQMAHQVINHSLALRENGGLNWKEVKAKIKSYLSTQPASPHLYRYLRTLFGQTDGPNITTVLAILPQEYLVNVGIHLAYFIKNGEQEKAA